MLIKDAFSMYEEEEIIAGGLAEKTLESYVYAEKLVSSFFGSEVDIEDMRPMDVRSFYQHLLTWQKPNTARGNIVCLRSVVRLCVRKNMKMQTLPEDIKVSKREKRMINFLTPVEVEEFIDVIGEKRRGYAEINRLRNIAIAKLLYCSGLRVGELCRLNRNSIKDRQFTIVSKSKMPRICFINQAAEETIEKYLKVRTDKNPALFISNETENRITPGNIRRVFQNACERSDFEGVHPHTLRHSFATTMLDHNIDLIYIGQLLGHESLDTTKMYTHYSNPKLKKIYDGAML